MPGDFPKVTITERRRILKYAEGDDPNTAEPFEVVEGEPITYVGDDAKRLLAGLSPQEVQE